MANKIIIPKAGYSALDDLDPDNIIFSSDYDTLKYDTLGETSLTVNFADYYHSESSGPFDIVYYHRKVVEVTHNLGYVPFFVGYFMDYPASGQDSQLPVYAADFISFAALSCYADSTKLYFLYYSGLANTNSGYATYNLKYRIFKNDLGL